MKHNMGRLNDSTAHGYSEAWPLCPEWSKDIEVRDCIFDRGYRQGISVVSVVNMLVVNTTCSNSWGTGPSNGVDIEPDHPSHRLE